MAKGRELGNPRMAGLRPVRGHRTDHPTPPGCVGGRCAPRRHRWQDLPPDRPRARDVPHHGRCGHDQPRWHRGARCTAKLEYAAARQWLPSASAVACTAAAAGRTAGCRNRVSASIVTHEVGDHWQRHHADIGDRLIQDLQIPEGISAISVALDRTSVPIEEALPRKSRL